jgi:hypothetical protein
MIAQIIRAVLLARAAAATFVWRLAINRTSHVWTAPIWQELF